MPDYKKMYLTMFNAAANVEQLVNYTFDKLYPVPCSDNFDKLQPVSIINNEVNIMMEEILSILQTAQIECEELYIQECETEDALKEGKARVWHTNEG